MPDAKSHELFPDAAPVTIEGVVERIVFASPDTGFFVASLRLEGSPDLTTCVGNLMAISPGETIRITGHWVDDKKFGRQVRVDSYETLLPSSVTGIEKYLGSGLIHGIGPTYAKRLVGAFGVETLKVIDEEPERLTSVEGIGAKRAAQLRAARAEQRTWTSRSWVTVNSGGSAVPSSSLGLLGGPRSRRLAAGRIPTENGAGG